MADFTTKRGLFARFTWMETLFLLTTGVLLAWSLTMAIIAGTYLMFAPFMMLLRIFFIMLVLRGIFWNKGALIFAGAVLVVAIFILIFDALLLAPGPGPDAYLYPYEYAYPYLYIEEIVTQARYSMLTQISNLISGTISFVTGFEFYTVAYDAVIQWALAIGLSIFVFIFGFFWFNFFALLSTVLLFGLVLSTGFFFYDLSFYIFIFSIVAYLIRYLNMRSMGAAIDHKSSPFALYALPFASLCLAVAIALPTPNVGAARQFTENFIRTPFNNINESLISAFAPRHFSLAQTGFGMGNTRRLGGNVTANFDTFMRINHQGPIYLTGNVFDRYTGFSWVNSFDEEYYILDFRQIEPNIEAFERLTSQFTMELAGDFVERYVDARTHSRERMRVWSFGRSLFGSRWEETTPRPQTSVELIADATRAHLEPGWVLIEHDIRKFTVFTTGLVVGISPPDDIGFLRDANGSMQSDELLPRHARYVIFYADLPEDIDRATLLAASRHGMYRDIYDSIYPINFETAMTLFIHNGFDIQYNELLREHLIPRAERINEIYTVLPEHFPERVSELAHHVVEQSGATTNLEKAIVLEDFLRHSGGFTYSLTPGNTPIDRDFVDYFLFDQQVGYCTYFASAFVTMARAVGLPTRYVEGFIVSGDADVDGYLAVINRQGHAWAEVYFEGFGWHRFDPTPTEAIFTWPYAFHPGPFYDEWDDYAFMLGQPIAWGGLFPEEYWDEMDETMRAAMMVTDDAANLDMSIGQLIAWSVAITTLLALVLLGGRVAYFESKKIAATKKVGNNEAAIAYFHQMLRYMRHFRFEIEPFETAMAFGDRVGRRVGFDDNRTEMIDLSEIFSRARYGTEEISDEDRQRMANAVKSLDKRLWGYMGPRKYILFKYIMCIV